MGLLKNALPQRHRFKHTSRQEVYINNIDNVGLCTTLAFGAFRKIYSRFVVVVFVVVGEDGSSTVRIN
jgi:hypothetical protein